MYSPKSITGFVSAQGIELGCLKERVHAGAVTLPRWLDFIGSNEQCRQACEHIVDISTLKYLFPLFMGKNLPKFIVLA
jgi:hypothetical protein